MSKEPEYGTKEWNLWNSIGMQLQFMTHSGATLPDTLERIYNKVIDFAKPSSPTPSTDWQAYVEAFYPISTALPVSRLTERFEPTYDYNAAERSAFLHAISLLVDQWVPVEAGLPDRSKKETMCSVSVLIEVAEGVYRVGYYHFITKKWYLLHKDFDVLQPKKWAYITPPGSSENKIVQQWAELKAWKKSAISIMPDYQAIGKLLELPLGASVDDKILPAIEQLAKMRKEIETLMDIMRVLFDCTLPGKSLEEKNAEWNKFKERNELK
jgi:hypothetical protein